MIAAAFVGPAPTTGVRIRTGHRVECSAPGDSSGRLLGAVGVLKPSGAAPSAVAANIAPVPRISEFYGIVIEMYYGDHPPPHFHARYGSNSAKVAIANGAVIAGSLPRRALRLVREWLDEHRGELDANWERAVQHEKPEPIDPLR